MQLHLVDPVQTALLLKLSKASLWLDKPCNNLAHQQPFESEKCRAVEKSFGPITNDLDPGEVLEA